MKKIIVFLLLLVSFHLFSDEEKKLKLAVMDLEDLDSRLPKKILVDANVYLRVAFNTGAENYIIIPLEHQKEALRKLRKDYNTNLAYESCKDKNCRRKLGHELSADLIVHTTISHIAGSYTLYTELMDLEKMVPVKKAKEECSGSPESIKSAIDKIVEQITGNKTKTKKADKSSQNNKLKDRKHCEYARNESSITAWETYLHTYPDGECAGEAKEKLDKLNCIKAKHESTVQAWKKYLKDFPKGYCDFEAKDYIKKSEEKEKKIETEKLKQKDYTDCEYARSQSSITAWETYLGKHSKGECVNEAKENIDKLNCKEAEQESTVQAWKKYLKRFPEGFCEFKAKDNIKRFDEEKRNEKIYEEEQKLKKVYSKVDERMESLFTGEYNIGITGVFDGYNKFGFSTGFDFNFNVYRPAFGIGAGDLFIGLGFDVEYYIPTSKNKNKNNKTHLLEIPIMANFGYYFRTHNYTLRYAGFRASAGGGIDILLWKEKSDTGNSKTKKEIYSSFAWEIAFNMIFRNRLTANFGCGGFSGKAYKDINAIHFFANIGWIL